MLNQVLNEIADIDINGKKYAIHAITLSDLALIQRKIQSLRIEKIGMINDSDIKMKMLAQEIRAKVTQEEVSEFLETIDGMYYVVYLALKRNNIDYDWVLENVSDEKVLEILTVANKTEKTGDEKKK